MSSPAPSHAPLYELGDGVTVEQVQVNDDAAESPGVLAGDADEEQLSPREYGVLKQVLAHIRQRRAVQIVAYDKDLTTQQAADILNVSRQHLVTLLDRGEIPFHFAGTHRRITLEDVLAYRKRRSAKRRSTLADIARDDVAQGTY
jgi:excisionase family DNA binding protein